NGDIVDFLAAPDAKGFDREFALQKLTRAVQDPQQRMVWDALTEFVAAGNRDLVLVLGNHDLELAMPACQDYLLQLLAGHDGERRKRVITCYRPQPAPGRAFKGPEFSCRVGGTTVCCVHGNEVDAWNQVDYGKLDDVAAALRQGVTPVRFSVNAGSDMVVG